MGRGFRIGGSLFLAVLLVGGAFVLQQRNAKEAVADSSVTIVTGTPVKQYVQTTDTDGDGIRDWEEELRGTDPLVPNEQTTTVDMSEATEIVPFEPPTTLTGQFALNFFEDFVTTRGSSPLSTEQQQALVTDAAASIASSVRDRLYTRADVPFSSDNSFDAVRRYGNSVGTIMLSYTVTENELVIFQRALETESTEELAKLTPILQAYEGMTADMLSLTAPSALAEEHLDLLNTFVLIANDIRAFQKAFNDPLLALAHAKRYQENASGLFYAIDNIRTALERANIVYATDEPGIFLFSLRP